MRKKKKKKIVYKLEILVLCRMWIIYVSMCMCSMKRGSAYHYYWIYTLCQSGIDNCYIRCELYEWCIYCSLLGLLLLLECALISFFLIYIQRKDHFEFIWEIFFLLFGFWIKPQISITETVIDVVTHGNNKSHWW